MPAFETFVGLLLVAVLLAAAARKIGIPYPAFLSLGGAILAFVPGIPRIDLQPDLALALFVAPVLLDTAYDASPRDLKDNWGILLSLVVGAVALTTAAVAWVTHQLIPAIPWTAAIALGAIVAPPDAAAASAVLRQVRPPHRVLTIVEGESLLNDAGALLIYRLAVSATLAHDLSAAKVVPTFLVAVTGSIVAGPALAWAVLRLTKRVRNVPSAIVIQFISTFGVWIFADRVGLSAVLTTVCYAMAVARRAPEQTPARIRVPSYAVWDTVVFLANVMAFVLIGLQIRPIFEGQESESRAQYLFVAAMVLLTVVVARMVWVLGFMALVRARIRRFGYHPRRPMRPPTFRGALVVAWCGMRGVVTLAAALALPGEGSNTPFPFRDLIVLTSFCVVLGTLVLQGPTLRPLLRMMHLPDDNPVAKEIDRARGRALGAALSTLEGESSPSAQVVRQEYQALLQNPAGGSANRELPSAQFDELRRRALAAGRHVVSEMRATDEIGDEAFHRLEEELDWVEMSSEREG